jgi:hypothetical protein
MSFGGLHVTTIAHAVERIPEQRQAALAQLTLADLTGSLME